MTSVLLQNSHHQTGRADGWSGAPGEALWVMGLNDRIEAKAKVQGVTVTRVDGDLQDHPEYHKDYDLFDAPHYEANLHYSLGPVYFPQKRCGLVPRELMSLNRVRRRAGASTDAQGHVGGWLWGRAAASLTAVLDDKIGSIFQQKYVQLQQGTGYDLPLRLNWNNPNITDYYGFRLTSDKTAGWLTEHGVGAPGAPDHDWLLANIDKIADIHVSAYLAYSGQIPVSQLDTSPYGPSSVTKESLLGFARATNPSFNAVWVDEYYAQCPGASTRVEFAFAQMLKESNYGRFTGVAQPDWNNPVGLGVTGPAGVGNRFPTIHDGVVAHLQHLLWYLWSGRHADTPYCTPVVDQRHIGEHKMLGNDIRLLNGKWAVPGDGYGESIADIAQKIREFGGHDMPDATVIQGMIDSSIKAYGAKLQAEELEPQVFAPIVDLQTRVKKLETSGVPHTHTGTVTIK